MGECVPWTLPVLWPFFSSSSSSSSFYFFLIDKLLVLKKKAKEYELEIYRKQYQCFLRYFHLPCFYILPNVGVPAPAPDATTAQSPCSGPEGRGHRMSVPGWHRLKLLNFGSCRALSLPHLLLPVYFHPYLPLTLAIRGC